jgi:hypothetical protein
MAINYTRVAEMLSDLEDFETEFTEFEEKFLATIQTNLSEYDSKFKFFDEQESTFQKIYDKYVKKVNY